MQTDSIFWASDSESAPQQRGRQRERKREKVKFYIAYQKLQPAKHKKKHNSINF